MSAEEVAKLKSELLEAQEALSAALRAQGEGVSGCAAVCAEGVLSAEEVANHGYVLVNTFLCSCGCFCRFGR